MAGSPITNMLGCSMMPARNQLIGSQHTAAPVMSDRPTGTPSTGNAMSTANGQNPPHTCVLVPKNSSTEGSLPPCPPPCTARPRHVRRTAGRDKSARSSGISGSMPVLSSVFFRAGLMPVPPSCSAARSYAGSRPAADMQRNPCPVRHSTAANRFSRPLRRLRPHARRPPSAAPHPHRR